MARAGRAERLADLGEAATAVFGRCGYRGTRTSDVARRAGMSAGLLFNYVESKEALFHLVFLRAFGLLDTIDELPLPTPAEGETAQLIEESLRKVPAPQLRAALATERPGDIAAELAGIVDERYDVQERLWPVFAVIERCAVELPTIEASYYQRTRVGYFGRLARYLEQRAAAGYLRPMPDYPVTARLVSETITWFAWHRREGRDAHLYDDDKARRTVVHFICAALLMEGRS